MVAIKVCITIATRFVPFATAGGSPMKIKNGKDNKLPPPAIVLIKPTTNPINTNNKYCNNGSIKQR
jgi:hypothetical protein